ncbi:hypothetical protein [Bartonella sp. 1-1C]|uniref:hypothetical protein n=1 Tax=Bartonella sp. 1-1C TaxID=515256 RepID=UPI0001F4CC65|nr:hypothetical protein [Bartonella sp. 1-1C]ATO56937.1 hypothetical protein B11Cv2_001530 [Bartonella sp. 1-1C]CBI80370.1 conserved hypothetical protein [Bartonella sp. 1-1C]
MQKKLPKSYMTDAEREELRVGGFDQNSIYTAESRAAAKADDRQAVWEWLAMVELPAYSLLFLKSQRGAQFIRDMGFITKNADEEYGPDWLDKGVVIGGYHF